MKISCSRIESFSDGLISIIITLMVFQIPLPQTMEKSEMVNFVKSIFIYAASYVIIGIQWNRHQYILDKIEEINKSFAWKNLIVLFFLSLIPLFMKWVLEFPASIVPSLGYAVIYLIVNFGMKYLFFSLVKENAGKNALVEQFQAQKRSFIIRNILYAISLIVILAFSFVFPEISIIFFIVLPVIMSVSNLFEDEK